MKFQNILMPVVLAVSLGGCVTTEPLLSRMGEVMRAESAPGSVVLQPVAGEVRINSQVAFDVLPRRNGYLHLFHVGSDGKTFQLLFPNAMDGANFVTAPTRLPRPTWQLTAKGPQGVGHYLAVLSEQPQDLNALVAASRDGSIRITGPYAASMTQIRETP